MKNTSSPLPSVHSFFHILCLLDITVHSAVNKTYLQMHNRNLSAELKHMQHFASDLTFSPLLLRIKGDIIPDLFREWNMTFKKSNVESREINTTETYAQVNKLFNSGRTNENACQSLKPSTFVKKTRKYTVGTPSLRRFTPLHHLKFRMFLENVLCSRE